MSEAIDRLTAATPPDPAGLKAAASPTTIGSPLVPPMPVDTPQEAEELSPGTKFRTPDGQVRVRPYDVTDDASYGEVPQGEYYREGGKTQQKPSSDGGVSPLAQTLYDMAKHPSGQKKALEYAYPDGVVRDDRGEFSVVTQDGKRLSPKARNPAALGSRALGAVGSGALPAVGGAAGSLAGIPASAGGPVAGIAGGVAGAGVGSAAGELGNQEFLKRLGIEDLPPGERAAEAAISGVVGAGGQGVAAAIPVIPAAMRNLTGSSADKLGKLAAWWWAAQPEKVTLAKEIADEGGRVPLTGYADQAPMMGKFLSFAKQFGYDPTEKAAREQWFPKVSGALMEAAGIPPAERNVIGQTAAASVAATGKAVKEKAASMLAEAKTKLETQITTSRAAREGALKEGLATTQRNIALEQTSLTTEADNMRAAADAVVKNWNDDLMREVDKILQSDTTEPGALSRWLSERIVKARAKLSSEVKPMYDAAHEMANGEVPNVEPLRAWAKSIVDEVPEALRLEFPREMDIIARLAGKETKAAEGATTSGLLDQFGKPITKAATEADTAPITFGDLHQLRTFYRAKVDWGDLTRGPKAGHVAKLAQEIDGVLNDASASPGLKAAAAELDKVDAFYAKNIAKFVDTKVRALSRFGANMAADDAEKLAVNVLEEGNLERVRMIRGIGGEDLWRQVVAADTRNMLNKAGAKDGRIDANKFAEQILNRADSGMLKEGYTSGQAEQLRLQADRIFRRSGKVPMEHRPGDTVFTMLDRADAAIERAESMASKAPIETFEREMKAMEKDLNQEFGAQTERLAHDPLKQFTGESLGAEAAAKKILTDPNMMEVMEQRFRADSPEWTMIRKTWLRQMVQEMADATIPAPGTKGGGLFALAGTWRDFTPETQQRLAPGVTQEQLTQFVRKLVMMFPKAEDDMGANLAGASLILHPRTASALDLPDAAKSILKHSPGVLARAAISAGLGRIADFATSPRLLSFIARGLDGTPQQRIAAEAMLRDVLSLGPERGAAGAAAATYGEREIRGGEPDESQTAPHEIPNWRSRVPATPGASGWRSRVP